MKIFRLLNQFLFTVIGGWQIVTFIYIYTGGGSQSFQELLQARLSWQLLLIIAGIIFTLPWFLRRPDVALLEGVEPYGVRRILGFETAQLFLLLVSYLALNYNFHLHLLELISTFTAIWMLWSLGHYQFRSAAAGWSHPTTYSLFIIPALLQGMAIILVADQPLFDGSIMIAWILIALVIDLLVVFARFQFLSKSSQITNIMARRLMTRYLLLFGTRLIIGSFLPLVYLGYVLFFQSIPLRGIGLLILAGTLLERVLLQLNSSEQLDMSTEG